MRKRNGSLAFIAFPLTKGRETGRGLDRVLAELHDVFSSQKVPFAYFDAGLIESELRAVILAVRFGFTLLRSRAERYFAIYPVAALLPLLLLRRPLVTAVHDLIPFQVFGYDNRIKYAFKRFCIRLACRMSDGLIVPFASTRDQICERFGVNPARVRVVPYGVRTDNYYPDSAVPKTPLLVGFLGEAKRAKGIDAVIRAFKLVHEKLPGSFLEIGSDGRELAEMKSLAAELLPPGSYRFLGRIPEQDMRAFYNRCSLLIFPSRYGFGLSVVESLACGTPALIGDCLDSRGFVDDEDLLVDPENPAEIADKAIRLFESPAMYNEKKTWGLEKSRQSTWEYSATGYLRAIRELSERPSS